MIALAMALGGLLGLAQAAPGAVLTPQGPRWLGPLPPDADRADVAVIDPRTGQLYLEVDDGVGGRRIWEGGAWRAGDDPLLTGQPGPEPVHYQWDLETPDRLLAVDAADGVRRRYFYDPAGRLSGALWPDGSALAARYDDQGRVIALEGPGPSVWRFGWGDATTVTDPWGRSTTLIWRDDLTAGRRSLEVQDALGHTAWTWFDAVTGRPVAWEDPRGLTTTLVEREGALRVTDGAGRLWELDQDVVGRVLGLRGPSGQRWRYDRDLHGRIVRITDPSGRETRWDRDDAGRVVMIAQGGAEWRLRRDEQGRVALIEDPGGARVELKRDSSGRVLRIVDSAGGEIQLSRGRGPWPSSVIERTGGRFGLSLDLLGRPGALSDPSGRTVRLERDGAGQLSALKDSERGAIQLFWSGLGQLSRIVGPAGASVGLERDGAGKVTAARRDGDRVVIGRDAVGEISGVSGVKPSGEPFELPVRRDPAGLPTAVGDTRFGWDPSGQVVAITGLGLDLRLDRDGSGWLTGVEGLGAAVSIERDGAGRPLKWSDASGSVQLNRDPSGRVRGELGAAGVKIERDIRGLINRLSLGDLEWRWTRDAAGRPLRVTGPRGLSLGVDWDLAGRPVLLRGSAGELARYAWEAGAALATYLDPAGVEMEAAGVCAGQWVPDGPDAWRWAGEGCGLPEESLPWSLRSERVAVVRGPTGVAERAVGAEGSVRLTWDGLGRLTGMVPEGGGQGWTFSYDAAGRLVGVGLPGGATAPLVWGAAEGCWPGDQGRSLLLSTGADLGRVWMSGPRGLVETASADWSATVLPSAEGTPAWVLLTGDPPAPVYTSSSGYPSADAAGIAGARGALQPFPGGPLFYGRRDGVLSGPGSIAVDPLSGRALDGADRWPWASAAAGSRLDPTPWLPESSWGRPVEILAALGVLPPLDDDAWVALPAPAPALSWLPAALDGVDPPFGLSPLSLPLDEDPITEALVLAVLPGAAPPDPDLVLRAVLSAEVERIHLPPGLLPPSFAWLSDSN